MTMPRPVKLCGAGTGGSDERMRRGVVWSMPPNSEDCLGCLAGRGEAYAIPTLTSGLGSHRSLFSMRFAAETCHCWSVHLPSRRSEYCLADSVSSLLSVWEAHYERTHGRKKPQASVPFANARFASIGNSVTNPESTLIRSFSIL